MTQVGIDSRIAAEARDGHPAPGILGRRLRREDLAALRCPRRLPAWKVFRRSLDRPDPRIHRFEKERQGRILHDNHGGVGPAGQELRGADLDGGLATLPDGQRPADRRHRGDGDDDGGPPRAAEAEGR